MIYLTVSHMETHQDQTNPMEEHISPTDTEPLKTKCGGINNSN